MRQHRPHPCASYPVSYAYTAYACEQICISFSRCPRPPPRGTTVSRTPLVAACDSHTRRSHTHVPGPASRPCRRPRATCAGTTRVPAGGNIPTNITRGSPHPGHGGARPRALFTSSGKPNIYEYIKTRMRDLVRAHRLRVVRIYQWYTHSGPHLEQLRLPRHVTTASLSTSPRAAAPASPRSPRRTGPQAQAPRQPRLTAWQRRRSGPSARVSPTPERTAA